LTAVQASHKVSSGQRMEIPEHCPPVLAQIMKRCWLEDPAKRPDFSEILDLLDSANDSVEQRSKDFQHPSTVAYQAASPGVEQVEAYQNVEQEGENN